MNLNEEDPLEKEVEMLGAGLGFVLVAIEFGILREDYVLNLDKGGKDILEEAQMLGATLKRLGKRVNSRFLTNRIIQMSKMDVSKEKQEFVTRLALAIRD